MWSRGLGGLLAMALAGASVTARAEGLSPDRAATILVRALAYDRSLATRAGDVLKVVVLFRHDDDTSVKMAETMTRALRALEKIKVAGLAFKVAQAPYGGADSLAALAADGIDAVFLSSGFDAQLGEITAATRKLKITSLTVGDAPVAAGVAVGLADEGGKPKIVINFAATKAEGAQFSSELFQLARVIK